MNFGKLAMIALAMGVSLGALQTASAAVLYDNGAEGSYYLGWAINNNSTSSPYNGPIISDSFELASNSTVNGIDFGLILPEPSGTIQTIDWSITAGPDSGAVYESGVAANPWSQFLYTDQFNQDIYKDGFSIPDLALNGGPYYLNLWAANIGPSQEQAYWEDGSGPSIAYDSQLGALDPTNPLANCPTMASPGGYCSESFQILGTVGATSVPEPGPIALFAAGLLALGAAVRLRRGGQPAC